MSTLSPRFANIRFPAIDRPEKAEKRYIMPPRPPRPPPPQAPPSSPIARPVVTIHYSRHRQNEEEILRIFFDGGLNIPEDEFRRMVAQAGPENMDDFASAYYNEFIQALAQRGVYTFQRITFRPQWFQNGGHRNMGGPIMVMSV